MNKAFSFLVFLILFSVPKLFSQSIKGVITERSTGEPLIGVTVQILGTTIGTTSNFNGEYELKNFSPGSIQLGISYVSFKGIQSEPFSVNDGETISMDFDMEEDNLELDEVVVTARKNLESENILIIERKNSTIAIENLGAKEMSLKGISNVADGVKKITGIALADAGQIYVRGLGDRYNSTSLNGMSIASPNPDNKLIPLDLFPSSTVKNITVGKVYQAAHFADYSGAHIDISTKDNFDEDYFAVSFGTGGTINTIGKEFYTSDKNGELPGSNKLSQTIKNMTSREFSAYILTTDPFGNSFSPNKSTSLPEFSGTMSLGKTVKIGSNKLNILASLTGSNGRSIKSNGYIATLNTQGDILNEFIYKSYNSDLKIAGLTSLNYSFGNDNKISYVIFYARNKTDEFKLRRGFDSEGINLIGSNSLMHVYSLINNQIAGQHGLGDRLKLNWSGSYGITGSYEPDRRQIMYRTDAEVITLFKLNKQETLRYFGELNEDELEGNAKLTYSLPSNGEIRLGTAYKHKDRYFASTRFYYNLNNVNETVEDVLVTEDFMGYESVADGTITIQKDFQPRSQYFASNDILAVFSEIDYYPTPSLLINLGLRYENSKQWVQYWDDASIERLAKLYKGDLFPALNLKYDLASSNIRFSASRTVTRPLFIEIAPFLYKESYGSDELRGNSDLKNGYNFNFDLKYELYSNSSRDIYSVALYYKYLRDPIERVQESSGGSSVHSFRNAEDGLALGTEIEMKKDILNVLRAGVNVALMYTNIVLPEGTGIYTDANRALQGASPYLVNADITYSPKLSESVSATISLMYNLQGPRIYSVGIYGMNNVIQEPFNTLNLVSELGIGTNKSIKFQVKNLLNSETLYTQKIPVTNETAVVRSYKDGVTVDLGFSYKF